MVSSLLERVAAREPDAMEHLIREYGGLIATLARHFLFNRTDVEDAVQDIFIRLWQNSSRFNAKAGSEITFVMMIARRRLINGYRRVKRRPKSVRLSDNALARDKTSNDLIVIEEAGVILTAMTSLREQQRQVLSLWIFEELTHAEIALRLGVPLGTVKSHARRALLHIRDTCVGMQFSADPEVRDHWEVPQKKPFPKSRTITLRKFRN